MSRAKGFAESFRLLMVSMESTEAHVHPYGKRRSWRELTVHREGCIRPAGPEGLEVVFAMSEGAFACAPVDSP
jgi:hypothetical protein